MIIKNGIDWTKVLHEYRIVFIFAILYLIVLTTKGALAANKTIFLVVFYISTLFNMMIFPFFLGNKMFTDSFRQVRRTLVFLSITIALMIISDFLYGQLFEHSIIESISKGPPVSEIESVFLH